MKTASQFYEKKNIQDIFKKLLEAISNPGSEVSMLSEKNRLFGNFPVFEAVAAVLLDNESSFSASGNIDLKNEIELVTNVSETNLSQADCIFVTDDKKLPEVFEKAKCGTLYDPHASAAIIISDNIKKDNIAVLKGPGIKGERKICVSDIFLSALKLRDSRGYCYPNGVDIIFASESGNIAVVPRLVKLCK